MLDRKWLMIPDQAIIALVAATEMKDLHTALLKFSYNVEGVAVSAGIGSTQLNRNS